MIQHRYLTYEEYEEKYGVDLGTEDMCHHCSKVDFCNFNVNQSHCIGGLFELIAEKVSEKLPQSVYTAQEGALSKQVGGSHYKQFAIQPTEYIQCNKLGFCEGNIIKYASRHKFKNGLEDVKKIKHYAELLAKLVYDEEI